MFGPKWPFLLILIVYGPGVVFVKYWDRLPCDWDRFCTLGRAPRTKETLPDFREWCRVTRHPRVFRRLTGCQRDTSRLGRHKYFFKYLQKLKSNVRNKAKVEGLICNAYLVEEASAFCAHYFEPQVYTRHRKVP